jgi:hypothetical protein
MAKQKKTAEDAAAPAEGATPTTPANQFAKKQDGADKFVRIIDPGTGKGVEPVKKIAPQARVIINAIEAAGQGGITRADLVANLKGVLQTRQPEGRILSYYQKLITETEKLVTLTKVIAPAA